jgi:2-keto-3-deoxy-L-rhamnonate aldolase RhmA
MTRLGFAGRLAQSDRCLFGTWVKIPAMETVEILADAGFDYIVIDQEHSPLSMESGYRATVAAQGLGMQVIVRVPDRSGSYLQRLLDSGVDGILVPRVTSVAEASQAVRQMIFSPEGDRGMGITARAGRWGGISRDEYLTWGNTQVMRAVQLEDREIVEKAEEIMQIDGLNGAFLGLGDLQLSTQLPASHPEIQALVDTMLRAARAHDVPCGTAVQTAEEALAAAERGFSFVMVSNDTSLIRTAATSLLSGIRDGLA